MGWQPVEETVNRVRVQDCSRRIVRVREVDQTGIDVNHRENAIKIVAIVHGWHFDELRARCASNDGINDE